MWFDNNERPSEQHQNSKAKAILIHDCTVRIASFTDELLSTVNKNLAVNDGSGFNEGYKYNRYR